MLEVEDCLVAVWESDEALPDVHVVELLHHIGSAIGFVVCIYHEAISAPEQSMAV